MKKESDKTKKNQKPFLSKVKKLPYKHKLEFGFRTFKAVFDKTELKQPFL